MQDLAQKSPFFGPKSVEISTSISGMPPLDPERRRLYRRKLHRRKMALKPVFERLGIPGFDSQRSLNWLAAKIRDAAQNRSRD